MADLSNRYANALFELSKESGLTNEYLEQAVFLQDALKDADCQHVITHPHISTAEKHTFFTEAFGWKIHDDLMGFLRLVVDKSREAFLMPVLASLIDMIKTEQRKTTAKVISAAALDDVQVKTLAALLSRKLNKIVDVSVNVDPSVIGGLYVQVDGFFIDRTLKNSIKDMKHSLKNY